MQNRETNNVTDKKQIRARRNETLYVVNAESMPEAKKTAYEILERLVMKRFVSGTKEMLTGDKLRTCCLESDGGKKLC